MRRMHGHIARPWTMAELAKEAALSRSAFFERFLRQVGLPPMEYLLAWRMAIAKDLLRRRHGSRARRNRRKGRLRVGQHLQHRLQPPRRPAAEPLRSRTKDDALSNRPGWRAKIVRGQAVAPSTSPRSKPSGRP